MADLKISQLTAATTPLAGTEVLPIVQNNTTKQVSITNLTSGRPVSATELTATTGNVIIGTSGKGVDFSATSGPGTSKLLNDYEEGTWNPVITSAGGSITSYTSSGSYTKVGKIVTINWVISLTNVGTASGTASITNAPFTALNVGGILHSTGVTLETGATGVSYLNFILPNSTRIKIQTLLTNSGIVWINGYVYEGSVTYQSA